MTDQPLTLSIDIRILAQAAAALGKTKEWLDKDAKFAHPKKQLGALLEVTRETHKALLEEINRASEVAQQEAVKKKEEDRIKEKIHNINPFR